MGIDPNDDSYEAGLDCEICDYLFDDVTPKYVLAIVQDIIRCPEIVWGVPNGAYLMTQDNIIPCTWKWSGAAGDLLWELFPAHSRCRFMFMGLFWFFADPLFPCIDAFVNIRECASPFSLGTQGYITLWWGPGIGKGPCD